MKKIIILGIVFVLLSCFAYADIYDSMEYNYTNNIEFSSSGMGVTLSTDSTWSVSGFLWYNSDVENTPAFLDCSIGRVLLRFDESLNDELKLQTVSFSGGQIPVNQWFHLTVSNDGTNIVAYINGSRYGNNLSNSNTLGGQCRFGSNYNNGGDFFLGNMSKLKVFEDSLTDSEVLTLFNTENGAESGTNFTIISNVDNFSVHVMGDGINLNYSTTGNTINTAIPSNYSGLVNVTATITDGLINNTYLNYNVSDTLSITFPYLNLSAYNTINNSLINNFTIIIQNTDYGYYEEFTTTNKSIKEYLTTGITYNVSIDAPGFVIQSKNFTLSYSQSYQFLLPYSNSINISILDQNTGNPITDNVTIRFTNNNEQFQNTTSTGSFFIQDLDSTNYTIEFISDNYIRAFYEVTVSNRSFQYLDAYMLNSTDAETTQFQTVVLGSDVVIEGVSITISRVINSSWSIVSVLETDITGRAQFKYESDIEYKIIASKSGYLTKNFTLNPIYFESYTINLEQDTNSIILGDNNVFIQHTPPTFYNNMLNNITFWFSNPEGALTTYGYSVQYKNITVYDSGTNAYGQYFNNIINITEALWNDTVVVNYFYKKSYDSMQNFSKTYSISGATNTTGTLADNNGNTYGLGIYTRILIIVVACLLTMGGFHLVGATEVGGFISIIIMGYFSYTGFFPRWAGYITMIMMFVILIRRSSQ